MDVRKLEADMELLKYGLISAGELVEHHKGETLKDFLIERVESALRNDSQYMYYNRDNVFDIGLQSTRYAEDFLYKIRQETGWEQLNPSTKMRKESRNTGFNTVRLGEIKGVKTVKWVEKPGIIAKLWRIWGEIVGKEDYAREGHIKQEFELPQYCEVVTEVQPVPIELHVANHFRGHIPILSGYYYYDPLTDTFHILRERV